MKTLAAVVLAGRANEGAFSQTYNEAAEALIPLRGRPLIAPVLDALADLEHIERLIVVAPPAVEETVRAWGATRVDPGRTITGSVRSGLLAAGSADRILFAAGDAPLLTSAIVMSFLGAAAALDGEFFYSVVNRKVYEERFPDSRRTYVRLKDGTFTGGNLFLADAAVVEPALGLVDRLYAARKNPFRMLRIVQPSLLLKLLLGLVTVQELEMHVSRLAGAQARAVILPHPEVAVDVDEPADLQYVESLPL